MYLAAIKVRILPHLGFTSYIVHEMINVPLLYVKDTTSLPFYFPIYIPINSEITFICLNFHSMLIKPVRTGLFKEKTHEKFSKHDEYGLKGLIKTVLN